MKIKTPHEPQEQVMSAREAVEDADRLEALLKRNILKAEPMVRIQIPFSSFLNALESFDRDELAILRQRVDEYLAA